ncbi:MAG: type II secretion system protein GspN [Nitrospiria bacterium]
MFAWLDNRKKIAAVFGYILFGLLTFLFFIYLTFPFHLLEVKLILALEEESGCEISVDKKGFHLPSRVSWKGIRATCPERPFSQWREERLDFNVESIDIRLAPSPLLWNRRGEIDFRIGMVGGEMTGHLTVAKKRDRLSFSLTTQGEKIDLTRFGLSGSLDLEGSGDWVEQEVLNGKGDLSFSLRGGRFKEIGGWAVPIGEVSFSDIHGKISWQKGRVAIDQFSARGNEVDLQSESGNLIIRKPLDGSLVTLTLKTMPKGDLKEIATLFVEGYSGREPLILGIRGPLRRPQISLNGRPLDL